MQIIKISPQSFKIILSKSDIEEYGESPFGTQDYNQRFFEDIIHRTSTLYGISLSEGTIDASFFESKDGGGELFLSVCCGKEGAYIFSTDNTEVLISLCKCLTSSGTHIPSTLYSDGGIYRLTLKLCTQSAMTLALIREYGKAEKAGDFEIWHLDEHAKVLCRENAVERIASSFT